MSRWLGSPLGGGRRVRHTPRADPARLMTTSGEGSRACLHGVGSGERERRAPSPEASTAAEEPARPGAGGPRGRRADDLVSR